MSSKSQRTSSDGRTHHSNLRDNSTSREPPESQSQAFLSSSRRSDASAPGGPVDSKDAPPLPPYSDIDALSGNYVSPPQPHPPSSQVSHLGVAYNNNYTGGAPGLGYGATSNYYPSVTPADTTAVPDIPAYLALPNHQPVYPLNGQINPPSEGVVGHLNTVFNFEAYSAPVYVDMVPSNPIAIDNTHIQRETESESFKPYSCGAILCGTLAQLKTVLFFTIVFPPLLTWAIFSTIDYTNRFHYPEVDRPMLHYYLMISIFLCAELVLMYWFIVVSPSVCNPALKRHCLGMANFLYRPLHTALAAKDRSVDNIYAQINRMDDARPTLFIRVEGYQNEGEYNRSVLFHRMITNKTKLYSRRPIYGFTHYIAVPIASASNISASTIELDRWYAQGSNYSAVSFNYIFTISPQDWEYLRTAQQTLAERYRGHEACDYIHTSIVYALDGVTPVGQQPTNALDETSRYDKYARPGINAALYRWHTTCNDDKSGDTQVLYVVEKGSMNCFNKLFFNQFLLFVHLLTFLYIPYVWLFRCCFREQVFLHKKYLRLQRPNQQV